jgi:SAM-dependent methyltransferase
VSFHESIKVESEVAEVAENWFNDEAYYEYAEKNVDDFWKPSSAFRLKFAHLDVRNVLELACGRGRHSWVMRDWGNRKTLVDIVPANIDFCRNRFRDNNDVSFLANDGKSLDPLPNEVFTSVFSYDAMVHFDHLVIYSYLLEIHRVLRPGGMALLHHSNYAANPGGKYTLNSHWRNFMPPGLFYDYCLKAGLNIVEQTVIPWGEHQQIDCLSLIVKPA